MVKLLHLLGSFMLMLLAGPSSQLPGSNSSPTLLEEAENLSPEGTAWVDSVYSSLTPRQRVAQLFVPHLVISDNEAGRATLDRLCKTDGVGGILLGRGTIESYASLINYAQRISKVPVLVTLDGEWGLAMRLTDAPRYPYNMALGAISDPGLLYDYGLELARQCRELGINVDFAPVMDVNSNPLNPVIGYRSYGENPVTVSRLGVAFSQGLEAGGVMSVSKHFPGHGDTSADSHKSLPTVDHSRVQMQSVDLLPFRDYFDAGLSGVMVGHLNVPSLDPSGRPASLSRAISTDLLRGEMGFRGMVWTDALEMKGASVAGSNNCVEALKAGADVLLGSAAPSTDIDAVMKAIETGEIDRSVVEERCRRMLAYKYVCGLANRRPINISGLSQRINTPAAEELNQRLANASITLLANADTLVPLPSLESNRIAVVSIGAPASNQFSDLCRKYVDCPVYSVTEKAPLTASALASLRQEADIVVVGVFSPAQWAREAFAKIKDAAGNLLPVFFINPYKMAPFGTLSELPELVAAYDDTPALRRAAAMAICGGIDVSGHFPVEVKGVGRLGQGIEIAKSRLGYTSPEAEGFSPLLTQRIDSIVAEAIAAKAFPGCQVLVARGGNVLVDKCYGRLSYEQGAPEVDPSTLYDIASMSKAIGTMGGLMKAYDEGLLAPHSRLGDLLPEVSADKADLRLSQLLFHESGIPATLNMNRLMMDSATYSGLLTTARPTATNTIKIAPRMFGHKDARLRSDLVSSDSSSDLPVAKGLYATPAAYDTILNRIYNIGLRRTKAYTYSCLNFALLAEIEQRVTGVDLDQWVDTEIFGPLGANHTGYRPSQWYPIEKIAPTEYDPFLRKQTVRGYVHDEMCAFAGGVLGNAGLFSTATDIAKYCQMLLRGGSYGDRQILSPSTVKLFTTTKSPTAERTLGFDLVSNYKSLRETGAPLNAFGHTGFTGTCFWIDPDNGIFLVFLSNRVNPSRTNEAFSRLNPRAAILKAVYQSIQS